MKYSNHSVSIVAAAFFTICIPRDVHASQSFCAVTERTPDSFVALRDGPGEKYKPIGRIVPSDFLWVGTEACRSDFGEQRCDESRNWVFVERVLSLHATAPAKTKGWAHARLIRQIACDETR